MTVPRIAQLVAVTLNQLLVKVLHREATVHLLIERPSPHQLTLRRTTRRSFADPTVQQSLVALTAQAVTPPTERPLLIPSIAEASN